jgi:hypothetical protein
MPLETPSPLQGIAVVRGSSLVPLEDPLRPGGLGELPFRTLLLVVLPSPLAVAAPEPMVSRGVSSSGCSSSRSALCFGSTVDSREVAG